MFQTEAHTYKFQVQGEQSYGYVLTLLHMVQEQGWWTP